MLDYSWQLPGSRTSQPGQQLSSSLPFQQRHKGLLSDRHKTSPSSGPYSKPLLPPGKSSNASSSDMLNPQKVHVLIPQNALFYFYYLSYPLLIVSQFLLMVSSQKESGVSTAVTSSAFAHSSKTVTSTCKLTLFLST